MKATINGVNVEGTPEEIADYVMIMTPSMIVRDIREESLGGPIVSGAGSITPMTADGMKEYQEKMRSNALDQVYNTQG